MTDILTRSLKSRRSLLPLAMLLALISCDPVPDEPTTPASRDEVNASCLGSVDAEIDSLFSGNDVYRDDCLRVSRTYPARA